MKKILILFFLILSFNLYTNEIDDIILNETIEIKLKVGINSFSDDKVYIKAFQGSLVVFFEDGEEIYEEILEENKEIMIKLSGNKIFYKNYKVSKIYSYIDDVISLTGISNDGKNYRKYRGDFEYIVYKNKIMPINKIKCEEYIYSVVPSEIGKSFPDEAIKAQSVAARTYLYYQLETGGKYTYFDVMDNVNSQMYLGYDREDKRINDLVNFTKDEVIYYNDKPINALYHSTSGGRTANNEDVWGGTALAYLRSVDDRGNEEKSPRLNWSYKISKKDFAKKMGFYVKKIKILGHNHNRIKTLKLEEKYTKIIKGDDLRRLVGYNKIFSTVFKIKDGGSYFLFQGKGSGHGVGMSQWGAYGLSEKNYKYKEILKHYYTGVEIKKVNRDKKINIISYSQNKEEKYSQ